VILIYNERMLSPLSGRGRGLVRTRSLSIQALPDTGDETATAQSKKVDSSFHENSQSTGTSPAIHRSGRIPHWARLDLAYSYGGRRAPAACRNRTIRFSPVSQA